MPHECPSVLVSLRMSERNWEWVLPRCPGCGEEHAHYAGRLYEHPQPSLGLRLYYCHLLKPHDSRLYYILVDADPEATEQTVKEIHRARRRAA